MTKTFEEEYLDKLVVDSQKKNAKEVADKKANKKPVENHEMTQ